MATTPPPSAGPVLKALTSSVDPGLARSLNGLLAAHPDLSEGQLVTLLSDVLIANDAPLSPDLVSQCDAVLPVPGPEVLLRNAPALHLSDGVQVVRQDITRLASDMIVNAANDSGKGCFVPDHTCVDNLIHRAAGPGLREACRSTMRARGSPLAAGTAPIVTPGFRLPAKYVAHVTGPELRRGTSPTPVHQSQLAAAYTQCLDAAAAHPDVKSIAFVCLSTGLFGYPAADAAELALRTVHAWQTAHPGRLAVVFCTYLQSDLDIYRSLAPSIFTVVEDRLPAAPPSAKDDVIAATTWLKDSDAVLVVAGAGMSVHDKKPFNVYVDPEHFARAYPDMPARGYSTAYECMGLQGDPRPSPGAKAGFLVRHMLNMRWRFPICDGYDHLKAALGEKDTFVYTSNVDGAFLTAGFPKDKLYRPQGDWEFWQCTKPCRRSSVFPSKEALEELLPFVDPVTGELPDDKIPACPHCGSRMMGNVRGGGWYLHTPYDKEQERFLAWVDGVVAAGKRLVVLEIGVGFNTPTVTRFPMEALVRSLGPQAALIRVNPTDTAVPADLPQAVGLPRGWDVLGEMAATDKDTETAEAVVAHRMEEAKATAGKKVAAGRRGPSFTGTHWRDLVTQLRR